MPRNKTRIGKDYAEETRSLTCKLSQDEWEARADTFADAQSRLESSEANKKAVMSDLTSKVNQAKADVSRLSRIVANREEVRDVKVKIEYDFDEAIVNEIRLDTDETYYTRAMTEQEKQGRLL